MPSNKSGLSKYTIYLALSMLVAITIGRFLLTTKHFHTHDDIQVFRVNEFMKCIEDKQIPCRWSKNLGKGYGYPLFVFYPPMIYISTALIHYISGLSIIASLNTLAFLTILLSAYSMYRFIYSMTKKPEVAFLSSALYSLYPYHASNIFVRGVYAETLAWSIFPMVLEGVYATIKNNRITPKLITSTTIILLTHNISSMILLPLSVLWAMAVLIQHNQTLKTKLQSALKLAISFLLSLGISAFFIIPMATEKALVQTESMTVGYYSFVNHFVSIKQLLISNFWGYGGSTFGVKDDGMSFMIGKPYWITFTALSLAYLYYLVRNRRKLNYEHIFFMISAAVLAFLTHAKSTPIWQLIKPLQYTQFPWRFIGISGTMMIIAISLILNTLIDLPQPVSTKLKKSQHKLSLHRYIRLPNILHGFIYLLPLIVFATSISFFKPEKFDNLKDIDFIDGVKTKQQQQEHIYDYMPKTVHSVPDEFATSLLFTDNKHIKYDLHKWSSNEVTATIYNTNNQDELITLSVLGYPGWQLSVDGEKQDYSYDKNYGLININIKPGQHTIDLRFKETPTRVMADTISIVSVSAFILLLLLNRTTQLNDNKQHN